MSSFNNLFRTFLSTRARARARARRHLRTATSSYILLTTTQHKQKPNSKDNKPKTRELFDYPSGDVTAIEEALVKLSGFNPQGGTCPGEALQNTLEDVQATPSERLKVVLVLTDGLIQNSDQTRSSNNAQFLRDNGAVTFSLAVGTPQTAKEKRQQERQLYELAGTEERIFRADSFDVLDQLVDMITALTLNTFTVWFDDTNVAIPACPGDAPPVIVDGPSLHVIDVGLTAPQRLDCIFSRPEWPEPEIVEAHRLEDRTLQCPLSGSLGSIHQQADGVGLVQRTFLDLSLVERATGQRRQLGKTYNLDLPMRSGCIAVDKLTTRCLGAIKQVAVRGSSMPEILNAHSASALPTCLFQGAWGSTTTTGTVSIDKSTVTCTVKDDAALDNPADMYSTFSLVGGDADPTQKIIISNLPVNTTLHICGETDFPTSVCWREAVPVAWSGPSVEWFAEQRARYPDVDVDCALTGVEHLATNGSTISIGEPVISTNGTRVTCLLPPSFAELSSKVDPYQFGTVQIRINRGQHIVAETPVEVLVNPGAPCVEYDADEERCLGESTSIRIRGKFMEHVQQQADLQLPTVCSFTSSDSGVTVESLGHVEGESLVCTLPSMGAYPLGAVFDKFSIASNNVVVLVGDRSVALRVCAAMESSTKSSNGGKSAEVNACWGATDMSESGMVGTGQTLAALVASGMKSFCAYPKDSATQEDLDDGNVLDAYHLQPLVQVTSSEPPSFFCALPAAYSTLGTPEDNKRERVVRLVISNVDSPVSSEDVLKLSASFPVSVVLKSCLTYASTSFNGFSCWGEPMTGVRVSGITSDAIQALYNDDVEMRCRFRINDLPTAHYSPLLPPTNAGNATAIAGFPDMYCAMPPLSRRSLGLQSLRLYVEARPHGGSWWDMGAYEEPFTHRVQQCAQFWDEASGVHLEERFDSSHRECWGSRDPGHVKVTGSSILYAKMLHQQLACKFTITREDTQQSTTTRVAFDSETNTCHLPPTLLADGATSYTMLLDLETPQYTVARALAMRASVDACVSIVPPPEGAEEHAVCWGDAAPALVLNGTSIARAADAGLEIWCRFRKLPSSKTLAPSLVSKEGMCAVPEALTTGIVGLQSYAVKVTTSNKEEILEPERDIFEILVKSCVAFDVPTVPSTGRVESCWGAPQDKLFIRGPAATVTDPLQCRFTGSSIPATVTPVEAGGFCRLPLELYTGTPKLHLLTVSLELESQPGQPIAETGDGHDISVPHS